MSKPIENSAVKLTIRLTSDEYKQLENEAKKLGSTVSYIARKRLFSDGTTSLDELTEAQEKHRILLVANAMKSSFKRLVDQHKTLNGLLQESLGYAKEGADNSEAVMRFKADGANILVMIQQDLNRMLELMGSSEIHIVARKEPAQPEPPAPQVKTMAEAASSVNENLDKL